MNLAQKLHLDRKQLPIDIIFALLSFALWLLSYAQVTAALSIIGEIAFAAIGLLCSLAFALRSAATNLTTFAIFAALLIRYLIYPTDLLPADLCILFALFYISVRGTAPARFASFLAALISGALLSLPFFIVQLNLNSVVYLLFSETIIVITAMLGSLKRLHDEQQEAIRQQEIAQARDEMRNADLAVAAERTRIAREMHDIVAHTLSVVIAQADGGRYAAEQNPQAAQRALETIAEMSRAALADIRSIIGVLRDPAENTKELRPQPIDKDIAELVNQMKESGKEISFIRIGQARALPVGLGNALYRICQEALTNSLKHAGPNATIAVILKWEESNISLEIVDDGRGPASRNDGRGHGIIGMRERAAVFGGIVEAGPKAQGGFHVKALIPMGKTAKVQKVQSENSGKE